MNFVQLESGRLIPTRDLRIDSYETRTTSEGLAGLSVDRDRELERLVEDHKDFTLTDEERQ